ncbi:uncharacterized protein LOC130646283 [Hydractinia symbiolongicarpus]|uniref:uncharacterized protein LOC130646283 n=1 Tax=Hydractinia symbiolongicarpus TaxID=13093 RepID=UPI00254CDAA5|nr:uncharacterized protein LOC130646283 [Hydractinia symbiolongicarpus]
MKCFPCTLLLQSYTLTRRHGPRKLFIGSTLAMAFSISLLPTLAPISNKIVFWLLLIAVLFFTRVAICGGYLAVNILVNNSVTSELLGIANGLGTTIASETLLCTVQF